VLGFIVWSGGYGTIRQHLLFLEYFEDTHEDVGRGRKERERDVDSVVVVRVLA
jgi:hypothetical protein